MKTGSGNPVQVHGLLVLLALAYGTGLLYLSGRLSPHAAGVPYHLLQAQAMLEGHLGLGNSLAELRPGLAWHNDQVQQVWGLGIAVWLLPFQAVWRLMGGQWFPDQIALGLAFGLLALYTSYTGLQWAKQGKLVFGIGFIWIILLNPPLWTLARGSQLVFEETVLYGLLLALGILVAVVRVVSFNSNRDFWICCILAAFSGLVRPTLLVYAVCAVMVCSVALYLRSRSTLRLLAGICVFLCGLAALAWTNQDRFGSPLEFGHRLTVSSQSMVFLTRFGNPYHETPTIAASKELGALLFLSPPIQDNPAFSENWFPGQAPEIRWRRLNLSSFDLSYLVCMVLGLGWRVGKGFLRSSTAISRENGVILPLLGCSGVPFAALFLFYLHYPSVASRYLLDFLPALTGFILVVWYLLSGLLRRWSILVLAGWLICELTISQVIPVPTMTESSNTSTSSSTSISLNSFGGVYSTAHHPSESDLWFNGSGWDKETTIAEDVVILAVDKPEFVELHISPRRHLNGLTTEDNYEASIDGKALHLQDVKLEGDDIKVTFDVPDTVRQRSQILFLAFSKDFAQADRDSERFLTSVRWR